MYSDIVCVPTVVVTETISTHYIDASGNTWNVEVSYGPEAGIPSGATLRVSELTGDAAEAYYNEALKAVENDGNNGENAGNSKKTTLKYAKALDISILKDGVEVHPVAPVSVSIKLLDAPNLDEFDEANVVHFGDEAEVGESNIQREAVGFETDAFSVYVVTYTLSTFYMDAAGQTFNIEVTYGTEAGIPENAKLEVAELEGDAAEDYVARAAEALDVTPGQLAYAKAMDISILADGERVQPQAPVKVSVKLLDAPEEMDNVNVLHFGEELEQVECTLEGETVEFEADGFSVYVVTFTVADDTEKALDIKIDTQIDGSTQLSTVLEQLAIDMLDESGDKVTVGVISEVQSNDTALVVQEIKNDEGATTDWTITPTAAFDSVALTLTLVDNKGTVIINVKSALKDTVTVTITEHSDEVNYDGEEHTVSGYDVEISNPLYTEADFTFSGNDSVSGTNAGSYDMELKPEDFTNTNDNYDVTFETVDGQLMINPIDVTVTITEHSDEVDYDGEEHTVSGYDVEISNPLYTVADFTFSGTASVSGTDAGSYAMEMKPEDFANTNDNFASVTFAIVDGQLVIKPIDVTVTITEHSVEVDYDGNEHTVTGYDVTTSNPLYTEADFTFSGTDSVSGTASVTGTDAGNYNMELTAADFTNTNSNFASVTFAIVDGKLVIKPIDVTVTITEHSDKVVYDGEEHTVTGYDVSISNPLYTEADFTFSGTASVSGTDVDIYNMELKPENFTNTNANFAYVTFEIVDGTLEITRPTVTPVDSTYDGEAHALVSSDNPAVLWFSVDGGAYTLGEVPTAKDARTYTVSYRMNDEEEAQSVTATINPAPVTLTANSATETKTETGEAITVSGFTCSVNGLAFDKSVKASGSGTVPGMYDVTFEGVTLKETKDTTGNYVVTAAQNGLLIITEDYAPDDLISKKFTGINGDLAGYEIGINPNGITLNDGKDITIKDTFSDNQSINYGSVRVVCDGQTYEGEDPSFDYSGYTGTFTVPDGQAVTITYTTRVKGSVGDEVDITNTATLGRVTNRDYASGPSATVTEKVTITPTGSDISGTGGVYSIKLYVYAEGHMERGLEDAEFRLLDSNMRPMVYKAGTKKGQPIVFATDEEGYADIALDEAKDGLAIRKNSVYYLEMTTAPFEILNGEYIYYQKDNTYYSFLITDEPSYKYGNIYSYFNGDVLKVRCYPEGKGVNVTKRFGGNYTLTDAQKNAITFILQKEAPEAESGWVDVESHTYREFSYGSINFQTGREGGAELEDNATYRIIEENALPEELEGIVEENVSVSISYQKAGVPVQEETNEFFVDPDDKAAFSYDLAFTNEYVDHKLTVIKIDGNTGKALPGAVFTVYDAQDNPVATYEAGDGNSITIRRGDAGTTYAADTLYYVAETHAPEGYITPANPEKIYFYFSDGDSGVPEGLPADASATDLTTSYNTVTLANRSEAVDIPVTVTWGVKGDEAWPDDVKSVVIGLYRSVDGAALEQVTKDGQPLTLELTKDEYYDTATFVDLPAQKDKKDIVYSVVEEKVCDASDADISSQFASSSNVSGTGWYVVNNQPAVSVVVQKAWLDLDGNPVEDASGKPEVTFDLYRTTTENEGTGFKRDALIEFLVGAERVRRGLKLSADSWSTTVDSLQETDKQGNPYYYFTLEQVPDNHEDSYAIAAATEDAPRTLTISNKQTPFTVTIAVNDLEKTYGDETPDYVFTADVKEDGATVEVSGPDDEGNYTATVTSGEKISEIKFTVSRENGENAGTYVVTPSGDALQSGYRVLYESGTLTINKAAVTITAGAVKTYGDDDPALVAVEGMKNEEDPAPGVVLNYTVSREEGEDVGEYPITLSGAADQGNYTVTYIRRDGDGKAYTFKINRATATVTAKDNEKSYGDDDPEFTADVTGLKFTDEATVLNYDLTRTTGEDVGTYTITPTGDAEQGNYNVVYKTGTFTIGTAALTIKAENDEKTYGDIDPEWVATLDGLKGNDEGGELTSVLNEETGARDYTYTVGEGESSKALLKFSVNRKAGENVGDYTLTPSGEATQGNYAVTYQQGNKLTILRAELLVTPDHIVKAVGLAEDPLLTAAVTGWMNGDEAAEATYEVGEGENAGVITWIYTREGDTLLTFSLKREAGETEGEYPITATGGDEQSNYTVEYEEGVFEILAILDIDVTQPLTDHVDADANPTYAYTAILDLAGTGLTEYDKNGFEMVDGVPTQTFTLPAEDKSNMKTLKVPGGAKLTVWQTDDYVYGDYTTAVRLDGAAYADPDNPLLCRLDRVDTYHEIAFAHSRISLPVSARAAVGQTEDGATELPGREGAMGIPTSEDGIRAIDTDFADDMHSKIGYVLPVDKYYAYDHASLYTIAGAAIAGASNVTAIKYDGENAKWLYKTDGNFVDVPENTQLVLFYLPKYVCKIGAEKFYSLRDAVEYADANGKTATIEMLIGEYSIRSKDDAVTIPADCTITITTAQTEYEGTGTAVISRSMSYTSGHLFYNDGTLTFDTITLDGKGVQAEDALVLNRETEAILTVNSRAALQKAKGVNGGAIYVKAGTVNVNGTLSNNAATNGGAVYVNGGKVTLGGALSGNTATSGGAVYVNAGEAEISGTVSGNTATSGGAVYLV